MNRARFFGRSRQQWHADFGRQPKKNWRVAWLVVVFLGLFLGHDVLSGNEKTVITELDYRNRMSLENHYFNGAVMTAVQKSSRAGFPIQNWSGPVDKAGPLGTGYLSQVRAIDCVECLCCDACVEFSVTVGLAVAQARATNNRVSMASVMRRFRDRPIGAEDLSVRPGLFDHPASTVVSMLDCRRHFHFPLRNHPRLLCQPVVVIGSTGVMISLSA